MQSICIHYAINIYSLCYQYVFMDRSTYAQCFGFFLSSLSAKTLKLGFSIHLQSVPGTVPQLPQSLNQQPSLDIQLLLFFLLNLNCPDDIL